MRRAANSRLYRRRAFWVLLAACLALSAVVPWSTARAVRLLHGPSVLVPGDGFSAVAVTPDGPRSMSRTGDPSEATAIR